MQPLTPELLENQPDKTGWSLGLWEDHMELAQLIAGCRDRRRLGYRQGRATARQRQRDCHREAAVAGRLYLHVGLQQREGPLEKVALKRVFSALRPAVMLPWLRTNSDAGVPPRDLPTLLEQTEPGTDIRNRVAGVCAGVARRFDMTATTVRVITVASVLLAGLPVAVYVVLWIFMPSDDF